MTDLFQESVRRRSGPRGPLALLLVVLATAVPAGCGGNSGPPRFKLSGSVTRAGKPIPAGRVVFEPDASKENKGPAAYASIKDGRYETPRGKGTVGGPHVVRIAGTDGVPGSETPQGMMLFSEYRTTAELPKEDSTKDFDVPATHR